ncbi:hypothetical protein BDV95DRAFT_614837 [Massariosphaeria phaeospora]|uniref:Probable double zinc ribbon domain-containing protein n=1 Tax=Massariosphaeria phaeospora TaxID=100035 RepID=A0A7C8MBA7_9PLEO|nr:hypothetical protein BDV95DRAFT_614837 [Massariosphaeria phaeospora]
MFGKSSPVLPPLPSRYDIVEANGFWTCNCGTENQLKYSPGPHPVGFVRCKDCGDVIDPLITPSPLATRWVTVDESLSAVVKFDGDLKKQVPYFTICSQCGLSHRAKEQNPYLSRTLWHAIRAKGSKRGTRIKRMRELKEERSYIRFDKIECARCHTKSEWNWQRFVQRYDGKLNLPTVQDQYWYQHVERVQKC